MAQPSAALTLASLRAQAVQAHERKEKSDLDSNYLLKNEVGMEIIELSQRLDLVDKAVNYFWGCWGNQNNYKFYQDCIHNSVDSSKVLPKFYLGLDGDEIIASYALLTNDIISRQDLYPWLACLFVNTEHRNKGLAEKLLNHGLNETLKKGFYYLYLSTDLENFYEKKGWTYFTNGFNIFDTEINIYIKSSNT